MDGGRIPGTLFTYSEKEKKRKREQLTFPKMGIDTNERKSYTNLA